MPKPKPTARPMTIAHRGACGYLPEHSLAAKAMAHAMGADYLEQDLVATRDDQLVVLHDIHIDRVTDVARQFPEAARDDGRFYARDFTLAQLQTLRLTERTDAAGAAVFPGRFPVGSTGLRIVSLDEELQLIRGMNASTGRIVGIYSEIKKPQWHYNEGVDVAALLLERLAQHGYARTPEQVWLQCFDLDENIRLSKLSDCPYRLIQLIGDDSWQESPTRYSELLAPGGLAQLTGIVAGIGPWLAQLYAHTDEDRVLTTDVIEQAKAAGLAIHPYTLRADALPAGFSSFEAVLDWLVGAGVDGIFTDFCDRAVAHFDALALAPATR
ncbi:MAG: glycerophosphodiester phosphodiesterase [Pseudomonadota bacterium]